MITSTELNRLVKLKNACLDIRENIPKDSDPRISEVMKDTQDKLDHIIKHNVVITGNT